MSIHRRQTIIRAGWLIDGQGGAPLADQVITIKDGLIRSIEPASTTGPLPDGALDFSNATILPALIDAHAHLAMSGTIETAQRKNQLNASPQQVRDRIERNMEKHNFWGIAAVRDAGDKDGMVLQATLQASNPYVAATCWAWHAKGRYGNMIGRQLTRETIERGDMAHALKDARHIKLIQSGLNSLDHLGKETPPQFSTDQLTAIVGTTEQLNLPLMVHANGRAPVAMAIDAGCRSIEHGYFMGKENLMRMADHQIFWVPTIIPMAALAKGGLVSRSQADVAQKTVDHQLEQIEFARRKGVPMALGTDAGAIGVHHGVSVVQEIALYTDAGMPMGEATRSATLNNARLMKLEKQGALRVGWIADMMAVKGEPSSVLLSMKQSGCIRMKGEDFENREL